MRATTRSASIGSMTAAENGPGRTGRGVDPLLRDRWFEALYESTLLFSGILDRDGRVLEANRLSIEGCGLDRDATVGGPFWQGGWWAREPELAGRIRRWCEEAVRTGVPRRAQSHFFLGDGTRRYVDLSLFPLRGHTGQEPVTHLVATGSDITEAVNAQRDRQEHQQRELELVMATEQLAADRLAQLSAIALAVVEAETVGDLGRVVVTSGLRVLGADGGFLAVRDTDGVRVVRERSSRGVTWGGRRALPLASDTPAAYVCRTGHALLPGPGDDSAATLPLQMGDRVLGALGVSWNAAHDLSEDEMGLLRGFAAQCAQGLDRVQRLERARAEADSVRLMSEMLQRSSLSQPSTPHDLQLAARYRPAEQAAQIGGDWYDAFVDTSGATLLTVGDVNGHDQTAAAAMGQVRNLLRGLAYDSGEGPARLQARLDAALVGLQLDVMATAVVARVDPVPVASQGGIWRCSWSSAGHLPPLHRRPDGRVARLEESEPDLMLGVDVSTTRHQGYVDLVPGSALLLYTDGLVERRGEHLDAGIDALAGTFSRLHDLAAEDLCDAVLEAAATSGAGEDDIAVLVLVRDAP